MKSFFLLLVLVSASFSQSFTIPVWPDGVPGAINDTSYREDTVYNDFGEPRAHNVTYPMLYIYLPSPAKAKGSAVVICPGGGYMRLAIDKEGIDIAHRFNDMGVAGIVLKYRLPSDRIMKDKSIGPLQDVQEAIRIVRRNASQWKVDRAKVGVIGFSAGGHLAACASTLYDDHVYNSKDTISARPDFSILIYPVISMDEGITHHGSRELLLGKNPSDDLVRKFSTELQVNQTTPPAFLVHAADDATVPVENSIRYFEALKKYSIPVELHVFQKGGHGFGLGIGKGTTATWPEECMLWLKQNGFVTK